MRSDVVLIVAIAGLATWALRFFPTRADLTGLDPKGWVARLLSTLGPAAIAALFVAEISPELAHPLASQGPLAGGVAATLVTFLVSRSVVGATLAGAAGYGLILALFG